MPEPYSTSPQVTGQADHFAQFVSVARSEHHVERKWQIPESANTRRLQHSSIGSFATQTVMRLLTCAIQTEGYAFEPFPLSNKYWIDVSEIRGITNDAELIVSFSNTPDDFVEVSMDCRFASCKGELVYLATFAFRDNFLNDFHRQVASGGVALLKAMEALQVAAVGQLYDNSRHWLAPPLEQLLEDRGLVIQIKACPQLIRSRSSQE
jgi:hypothetical protein